MKFFLAVVAAALFSVAAQRASNSEIGTWVLLGSIAAFAAIDSMIQQLKH